MRTTLLLLTCLFLFTACADDNYYGGHDDDRYRGGNSYGGYGGYGGYNDYGNYYPYGNASYPRNRIYVIDGYRSCRGYPYQGYCYLYKEDYQKALAWDRSRGYDDNWHKKRKDWCNKHDCRRDHDTRDDDGYDRRHDDRGGRYGTTDAKGRPLEPKVEKDRGERVDPRHFRDGDDRPAAVRPSPGSSERPNVGNDADRGQIDRGQPRYRQPRAEPAQPRVRESRDESRQQSRDESRQPSVQRQQRVEPVQTSRPASNSAREMQKDNKPQRGRAGRSVDTDAAPE